MTDLTLPVIAAMLLDSVTTGNLGVRLTHLPASGEIHDLGWAINDLCGRFETLLREAQGVLGRHVAGTADQRLDPRGFSGTFVTTIEAFNSTLSEGDRLRNERECTLVTVRNNATNLVTVASQLTCASKVLSENLEETSIAAHTARDAMSLPVEHTRGAAISQAIGDTSHSVVEANQKNLTTELEAGDSFQTALKTTPPVETTGGVAASFNHSD